MKFGVREICDVVLKAKSTMKVGSKTFYKGEPVIYFDTLKSSGMEGTSTTVYAQGGRGNARLMGWEGEKTVTFTMEDALISPVSFMILAGAGLVDGTQKTVSMHVHEQTDAIYTANSGAVMYVLTDPDHPLRKLSKNENAPIYVMGMKNGEIITEPFIGKIADAEEDKPSTVDGDSLGEKGYKTLIDEYIDKGKAIIIKNEAIKGYTPTDLAKFFFTPSEENKCSAAMIDYYVDYTEGASQIEITPDAFGGNFYLEASTLFRNTDGVDMPAEFVIPNCKVQSNFNFQMSASGDPSTFTFTLDAFPDYTKFDSTHKVMAAIQILEEAKAAKEVTRTETNHVDK